MFDLFRSRAKAVRYLLGALLMLVALSMVITLIPGYGGGVSGSEQIVAEIGKEALTMREVAQTVQNEIRNKNIPPSVIEHFVPMLINRMIAERAVAYQAERLGFQVTDAEMAQAIQTMIPQLYQGGQFVGRDAYAQFLAQSNMTISDFESGVRKQLLISKLSMMVLEGQIVTPNEIEEEYRKRNEKIKLDYFAIDRQTFRSKVSVSRSEIEDFYNKNKAQFPVAPKRNVQLLVADEQRISESVSIAEEDLRRYYESEKDRFRTPERVRARHILLKTTDKSEDEVKKIQSQAEDLLKQIKGGADFAELAKKHSEDPGTATKGGDLDWLARGQTVKNFEDTAFSLKPKEFSNVVKTEYGFHIIQVMEKEQARLRPFSEVKDQFVQERKRQLVFDRMQRLMDQAKAEVTANPQQAAEVAQKLGLHTVTVRDLGPSDPIPEVGQNQEAAATIASLDKGGVTPVIQVGENKLVIGVVTEVVPERTAELSEVENQIRNQLTSVKAQELAQQKIDEAKQKLQEGDLRSAAKALGLELKSTSEFSRTGNIDNLGSAQPFAEAFGKSVGEMGAPVVTPDQATVFYRVVDKTAADMSKLPESRDTILNELKDRKAQERKELFEDGLLTQLVKEGKVKIYEDNVKRLASNYRS